MNRTIATVCTLLSALCLAGCGSNQTAPPEQNYASAKLPIINGTAVGEGEYMEAVFIEDAKSVCTGTLIAPDVVLTAGHCLDNVTENNHSITGLRIAIGNDIEDFVYQKVASYHVHPDYRNGVDENGTSVLVNDIAVLKLAQPVPSALAVPVPVLAPENAITQDDVDAGLHIVDIGFGRTAPNTDDPNDTGEGRTKLKLTNDNAWICPTEGSEVNAKCAPQRKGYLYFEGSSTICSGDSGGPVYIEKDGTRYVAGVNSFVYQNCSGKSAATIVTEHAEFIAQYAPYPAAGEEICDNGKDDNGDGLVDCDDPRCYTKPNTCYTEICFNQKDDNGDGKTDCDDPQCKNHSFCQPDVCSNGIDDNGDGVRDCNDPYCALRPACRTEICDNEIDDNGDGYIDCDDFECSVTFPKCNPRMCHDGYDNDYDGLFDCDDPECSDYCGPEDCFNDKDDNFDGKIDCDDPLCEVACTPENCTNKIDDNGDGKIDCDDPQCADTVACRKENACSCDDPKCDDPKCSSGKPVRENCSNRIDDNGDGLVDCDDPQCALICDEDGSTLCSAQPNRPARMPVWLFPLLLSPLALRRRSKR